MGLMADSDRRFANLEKKLGFFVIVAAVGIILLLSSILFQKDIFAAKVRIYTITDSGKGLAEGMAVKLSGVKIGKIKKMHLDDLTSIKLELSINRDYMKWIKTDSKAILVKEGLVGDSIIEILPGSEKGLPIEENNTIRFEREKGLTEMADEVRGEIKKMMLEVRDIIGYINDPEGDIRRALANINKLSAELLDFRKNVNRLIKGPDDSLSGVISKAGTLLDTADEVLGKAAPLMESVEGVIAKAEDSAGRVDEVMPDMIRKIDASLDNIKKMTDDLRKVVEKTAPGLPDAVAAGEEVLDATGEILDSVKKTWPINKHIESPYKKSLKVDSYE